MEREIAYTSLANGRMGVVTSEKQFRAEDNAPFFEAWVSYHEAGIRFIRVRAWTREEAKELAIRVANREIRITNSPLLANAPDVAKHIMGYVMLRPSKELKLVKADQVPRFIWVDFTGAVNFETFKASLDYLIEEGWLTPINEEKQYAPTAKANAAFSMY